MTMFVRFGACAALLLSVAACAPKGPAPSQCTSDANCFSGGVCNAAGTCVTGAAIDPAKSTVDVSQTTAVADGSDEVAVTVTLRDAAGNPLSSRGVQISVDGSATVTQPVLSTNAQGQATGKVTSIKAETENISAVGGIVIDASTGQPAAGSKGVALAKAASVKFIADASHPVCATQTCTGTGDPGQASQVSITAPNGTTGDATHPVSVSVDTTAGVKIHVVLKDQHGNPISSASVNWSITGIAGTFTPASGTGSTGPDGTFDLTIHTTVAQDAVLALSAAGIQVVQPLRFNPAPVDPNNSSISLFTGPANALVECDANLPTDTCTVKASSSDPTDVTRDPVTIQVLAKDQFGNVVQDGQVWFSQPDDANGNPVTADSGATVTPDALESDYCESTKGLAVGACEGVQGSPLLTRADGKASASFTATKAGTTGIVIHLVDPSGDTPVPVPIVVTAAAPDPSMSYFAVVGAADGSPTIANNGDPGGNFGVIAYVADKFDNPIQGKAISFSVDDCGADPTCASPVAPPPEDNILITNDPDNGTTNEDGFYSGFYSAQKAGYRMVTVTGDPATTTSQTVQFKPGDADAAHSTLVVTGNGALSPSPAISADGDQATITLTLADAFGNALTDDQDVTLDAVDSGSVSCAQCTFTLPSHTGAVYSANLAASKAQTLTVTVDVGQPIAGTTLHKTATLNVLTGKPSAANSTLTLLTTGQPVADNGTGSASVAVIQAVIKDAQNNPMPGVPVTAVFSPAGSASVVGSTPVTDATGTANITIHSAIAATTNVQVQVPNNSVLSGNIVILPVTLAQVVPVTFKAGTPSAAHSTFTAGPSTITTDANAPGATLTLTVRDANDNPVPNFQVSFAASPVNGGFTPAGPYTTDANGVVQATYKSTVATSETITATGTGFSLGTSPATLSVQAGSFSLANSTLVASTTSVTADGSSTFTLTATEKDSSGNAINHTVSVSSNGASVTIAQTGGPTAGVSTFTAKSTRAQSVVFIASDTNATGGGTFGTTNGNIAQGGSQAAQSLSFVAGVPSIANSSGVVASGSPTTANGTSKITLAILVRDANNNPVPSTSVVFTANGSNGNTLFCPGGETCNVSSNVGTVTASSSGVYSIQIASTKAHSEILSVSVAGTPLASNTINAVAFTAGAPEHLAFVAQPQSQSGPGPYIPPGVQVAVEDHNNNVVTNVAATAVTVQLAMSISPAPTTSGTAGTVANNVANTQSGVATFNALAMSNPAGGLCDSSGDPCRSLHATANGLAAADSATFHVLPPNASTGNDGPFHATSNTVLPANVVHNYTTFTIDSGVTVTGDGNGILDIRATDVVTINGTLSVAGGAGGNAGANGGGRGGNAGNALNGVNGGQDQAAYPNGGACKNSGNAQVSCTVTSSNFPSLNGMLSGANGGGGYAGLAGTYMGGGGAGGGGYSLDYNPGGGGGGGGIAGGAGGFAGADGCVQAGGAGGGSTGGVATGCGAQGQGGGRGGCGVYSGGNGVTGASGCTPIAGSGGGGSIGCDAASDLAMASTFRPGSGGGGGGNGGDSNAEALSGGGGGGGGGGGALRITSPTAIILGSAGKILADGGAGGGGAFSGDDCTDDSGGGGGGGSGGAIWLQAPVINAPSGSQISAAGGGGGLGAGTASRGQGGAGGLGRIRLSTDTTKLSAIAGSVNPALPGGANTSGKAYVVAYPQ